MLSVMLEKQDGCIDFDELFVVVSDNVQIFVELFVSVIILWYIGIMFLIFMMKLVESLDVMVSLVLLGIDFLMVIELCNWCWQWLGIEVMVLEIMGVLLIESLGMSVVERLLVERV